MAKYIAYTQEDGVIAIVVPAINTAPKPEDITEEEALERAWQTIPAGVIDPHVIEDKMIPPDRTFRNAWISDGKGGVTYDMEKARAIVRDVLRQKRLPLLIALDIAYIRADEAGDAAEKARIVAEKRRLRDITADPHIVRATTIEDLARARALL